MNQQEYERMFRVEDRHWWYVGLHELILDTIAREKRDGAFAILDAGCGTGRLCQLMQRFGDVEGCDASPQALDLSRSRGLNNLFLADLNDAELGAGRYDIITSIDVLYHRAVKNDANVLCRFYQALKPGGLLILNLVAFEFLRSTHDIAVHTRKRYSRKELLSVLKHQGFSIERASYRLGFLFAPIVLYRMAKKFIPHSRQHDQIESDVRLPPAALNSLLLQMVRAENRFLRLGTVPFGSSVFVVARRPFA